MSTNWMRTFIGHLFCLHQIITRNLQRNYWHLQQANDVVLGAFLICVLLQVCSSQLDSINHIQIIIWSIRISNIEFHRNAKHQKLWEYQPQQQQQQQQHTKNKEHTNFTKTLMDKSILMHIVCLKSSFMTIGSPKNVILSLKQHNKPLLVWTLNTEH